MSPAFGSFRYTLSNGIAGLHGNSVFNIFWGMDVLVFFCICIIDIFLINNYRSVSIIFKWLHGVPDYGYVLVYLQMFLSLTILAIINTIMVHLFIRYLLNTCICSACVMALLYRHICTHPFTQDKLFRSETLGSKDGHILKCDYFPESFYTYKLFKNIVPNNEQECQIPHAL